MSQTLHMSTMRTPDPIEELNILRGQKGHTCVSIIVPTHKEQPDKRTDELYVGQAVQRAADLLHLWYPEEAEALNQSMQELVKTIDFKHVQEGLGLFVSDEVQLVVQYPFPVTKKIVAEKKFELGDVLYKAVFSYPYYVLHLETEKASLYYGVMQHLEEVADRNFPCLATDDYDYQHPVRESLYMGYAHLKSFEQDKEELQKVRYHTFVLKVDDLLGDYLTGDTRMILCGAEHYTAAFLNQSRFDARLISVINGNYSKLNTKELAELVAPIVQAAQEEKMRDEIDRLEELGGQGLTEEGFQNVQQAVEEGRGLKLFIEKDFPYTDILYLQKKQFTTTKDNITTRSIEELIDNMLDKKGQVLLVEKDMLKPYGHIALITRY